MTKRAIHERLPPPPLTDKVKRGVWELFAAVMFRFTPVPFHPWRCFILRIFGAQIGRRVAVYPDCRIWAPWNLTVGDNATIGGGVILYNVAPVVIGEDVVVSQRTHLCTASHDYNSKTFDLIAAPIQLCQNAWVSAEAFVGPGVTVGHSAVVVARTVVIRSVAEREIVAGNPARVVGSRDSIGKNVLS